MIRICLILAPLGLLLFQVSSPAQSTDSLILRERLLMQENDLYIRMALRDEVISASQADSLRKVTSGVAEKPLRLGIDILFQVRDFIDNGYEEQMRIVNEPALEEYFYSPSTMLPSKLEIPADYISPEQREAARQQLAMEQMAESMAEDFEREKLPAWQVWWQKHIPFFFGNKAWFKGQVTFFNGQAVPVPQRDSRSGRE